MERIAENQFLLANNYPGTSLREQIRVVLRPPDTWHAEGLLRYRRLLIASYTQEWKLEPRPGGCELQMSLDVDVKSVAVRLFLLVRPGYITGQIEGHYDRIVGSLAAEIGSC